MGTLKSSRDEIIAEWIPGGIPGECPNPHKMSFDTFRAAEQELNQLKRKRFRGGSKKRPCRVYRCTCGQYHLTSKPNMSQRTTKIAMKKI